MKTKINTKQKNNEPKNTETEFLTSPEQAEFERRWPIALKELSALIDRIKDISRANPEELHKNLTDVEKQKLTEGLMNAILADEQKPGGWLIKWAIIFYGAGKPRFR